VELVPPVTVARFEEIEPGGLFVQFDGRSQCIGLKTARPPDGDRNQFVLLGPEFPDGISESFLVPWESATVVSFGKNYSLLLPSDPSAWFLDGPKRTPVCIAASGNRAYVCTNGGSSPRDFTPCFVEFETGAIIQRRLPTDAAYTLHWQISLLHRHIPPRTILSYPRRDASKSC
jgi:hypothetical protein